MNSYKKIKILFAGLFFMCLFISCNNAEKRGIAIVVDTESYQNAKDEIDAYASVLQDEGLEPTLLVKNYSSPDSLKAELISLYNSPVPIEGAVFIGDIPIVMTFDAQHMTSAFKMDQKQYGDDACVPTDRFYDDFDLIFDFIKQDSINKNRYYYSLNYQSKQTLSPDIYSGRIRMPNVENKYELLKKYMTKVVEQHKTKNIVDKFFFFSGHGYISESLVARLDEQTALYEQLPAVSNVSYLDHKMQKIIKFAYMSEMQREDLDIGFPHHHGDVEIEYLSGDPMVDTYSMQIDQIKKYLRDQVYREQKGENDINGLKKYFNDKLDIPGSWFNDAFDPATVKEDSAFKADINLTVDDFSDYKPNARFVIFDACYNGSFYEDKYLSGAYIFSDGKTVAAQGNSVNVIQDKWSQEMMGLLSLGMRVGEWNRRVCFLETHLIGDPTFRFTSIDTSIDVHKISVSKTKNEKLWLQMLSSEYADVQCLALTKLYENNYEDISQLLLDTYKKSKSFNVRTEAFMLLSEIKDENFVEVLKPAMFDDYEFIQRFAIKYAGRSGYEELIPELVKLSFTNLSKRVEFNYETAIRFFNKEKILAEFERQADDIKFLVRLEEAKPQIKSVIESSDRLYTGTIKALTDPNSTDRKRYNEIRSLRNSNYHQGVDAFLAFLEKSQNLEHKIMMLEALGWFTYSFEKEKIIDFCRQLANDETQSEAVKHEAEKTIARLS